jgi:hypothetical protein
MVKIIAAIVRAFHKWRLKQDFEIAKKHALELRYKTHKKYFVLYINGNFRPVAKQTVKELLQRGDYFKKGVNLKQVERSAYFVTD